MELRQVGRQTKRGLLGLVGIGNQAGDEIDGEVGRTPVPGVLELGDVLELIVDGFDNKALA